MLKATDLRGQLDWLRESLYPLAGRGSRVFHPVKIRPSLGFALVPAPRERQAQGEGLRDDAARSREALARSLAVAAVGGMGLVEGSESDAEARQSPSRQGMSGLTSRGAAAVEDLCSLVRQDRGLYALWTVTLPPEAALALDEIEDGATRFSDVLRRRFGEALARALHSQRSQVCGRPIHHWWFVIEPQKNGRPHWHFVFRCKTRKGRPWLLGKGRLDRLIGSALRVVTGRVHRVNASGNVQALRTDPGRYLSKYLRKGARSTSAQAILRAGYTMNMVPRRWWGCSRDALGMLQRYRFELPSLVVGWLSLQWPKLAGMGLLKARVWQPAADGAPSMVVGSWLSGDNLLRVIGHLVALGERAYPLGVVWGVT